MSIIGFGFVPGHFSIPEVDIRMLLLDAFYDVLVCFERQETKDEFPLVRWGFSHVGQF